MRIDENINTNINAAQLREAVQQGTGSGAKVTSDIDEYFNRKKEEPAATVDISEDGRNAQKANEPLLSNIHGGWTDKEFQEYSWNSIEGSNIHKGVIMTDYYYVISCKLNDIQSETDHYKSYEEKTNDLLGAYASLYDEIVKGYENGGREVYVEDQDSEDGYRKLTLESEIAELDKAFAERAERFKNNYDGYKKAMAGIADSLKEIARAGGRVDKKRAESTERANKRFANSKVPEDIDKRLVNASLEFKQMYKPNISIRDMLAKIRVF